MPHAPSALLALWNDVDPTVEAAYNDWHAREHVPERCTVPGILWGRRYGLVAGGGMPKYLTLYGLREAAVLDSAPYQRLLREPTPASRAMRPALRKVARWVCRLVVDDATAEGRDLAVRLLTGQGDEARRALQADAAGHLLAQRIVDAAPLPWLASSQDDALVGDWLWCRVHGPDGSLPTYRRLPVG
jgi:hypothetical protein